MRGGLAGSGVCSPSLVLGLSFPALGADFYVAPNASANGTGSFSSPWQLQTALNQPSSVHPGDTIWLRGGTYSGTFVSYLNGTSANAIVVRQYAGERGDAGRRQLRRDRRALHPRLLHLVLGLRGHELRHAPPVHPARIQPQRHLSRRRDPDLAERDRVPGLKFINLVIHDARQGVSFWKEATDAEINGCLIYYNGWNGTDRGHGHGIYTQNQTGHQAHRRQHHLRELRPRHPGLRLRLGAPQQLRRPGQHLHRQRPGSRLRTAAAICSSAATAPRRTCRSPTTSSTTRPPRARTPPSSWGTAPAAPTPPSLPTTSPTTRSSPPAACRPR